MFQSAFFNFKKRSKKQQKRILTRFCYTITLLKKQEAFDNIKYVSDKKKYKWKYKVFTEVEKTFFNLRIKMPWTIQMWLLED